MSQSTDTFDIPQCQEDHRHLRKPVMETLDSTELFMEDQTWLDYLWDFETRGINLDLPSDTD